MFGAGRLVRGGSTVGTRGDSRAEAVCRGRKIKLCVKATPSSPRSPRAGGGM